MRLTKSATDAGELAAVYKNTPEVYESTLVFFAKQPHVEMENQRFRKRGSKRFMREIQRARFLREAMGLKRQFEFLEASKVFRKEAESPLKQPDLQQDRTRSEG
jgi:hypothetical protein